MLLSPCDMRIFLTAQQELWQFHSRSLCQFVYEPSTGPNISMRQHTECFSRLQTDWITMFPLPTNPIEYKYSFWCSPNIHHIRESALLILLTTSFPQSTQRSMKTKQPPRNPWWHSDSSTAKLQSPMTDSELCSHSSHSEWFGPLTCCSSHVLIHTEQELPGCRLDVPIHLLCEDRSCLDEQWQRGRGEAHHLQQTKPCLRAELCKLSTGNTISNFTLVLVCKLPTNNLQVYLFVKMLHRGDVAFSLY